MSKFQQVQKVAAEKGRESVVIAKENIKTDQSYASEEDRESLLDYDRKQKTQLKELGNEVEFNEHIIAEREEGIKEIESAILEVNEIFRDLGQLVNEQQGMLDNIESNIESTVVRTNDATKELTQANKHQKNARKELCCMLLLLVLAAVVIIVLVLSI